VRDVSARVACSNFHLRSQRNADGSIPAQLTYAYELNPNFVSSHAPWGLGDSLDWLAATARTPLAMPHEPPVLAFPSRNRATGNSTAPSITAPAPAAVVDIGSTLQARPTSACAGGDSPSVAFAFIVSDGLPLWNVWERYFAGACAQRSQSTHSLFRRLLLCCLLLCSTPAHRHKCAYMCDTRSHPVCSCFARARTGCGRSSAIPIVHSQSSGAANRSRLAAQLARVGGVLLPLNQTISGSPR
jgi:hypothetical protein